MILTIKSATSAIFCVERPENARFQRSFNPRLRDAVRRSNQLGYLATDVAHWSFVGSNVPVMNELMDDMILNCAFRPFKI